MHIARVTLGVIAISVFAFGLVRQDLRAGAAAVGADARRRRQSGPRPGRHQREGHLLRLLNGGRNGQGVLPIRTSPDMRTWKAAGFVFESLPEWVAKEVPMARNAWAPDISYFNGSTTSITRCRRSAAATPPSVSPRPSRSIRQVPATAGQTRVWCCARIRTRTTGTRSIPSGARRRSRVARVGKLLGGIKMRRVDPSSGKLSAADETMHSLSSRPREQPINGSVEAPFIVRHGDYCYLSSRSIAAAAEPRAPITLSSAARGR